jgi:beta-galactosidase
MVLPETFTAVEWFGAGPGESYPDSRRAALVGRYARGLAELQTPYVFPQENGTRSDVRWVRFAEPGGRAIGVAGESPFGFAARPWSPEQLDRARHDAELRPEGRTWVTLDYAQLGLGTGSCGPDALPTYRLFAHPFAWKLTFTAR